MALAPSDAPLVALRHVRKTYGQVTVLRDVDLDLVEGEFLVVLGPSGSGKTTILRLIGGFVEPSAGEILLDGQVINELPINKRPFNTVFQDYALFPHMSAKANVGYGLAVRGTPRAEIAREVARVLDLVSLGKFADRYPAQLSGGQRQRVALARAIVCKPRLILLDEPLAALDAELRHQMQGFLKTIQREIRTTFLFITHDQSEAITLADRICVMDHGAIIQVGTPDELYYRPKLEHVARFFGDNNLIRGKVSIAAEDEAVITSPIGPIRARFDPEAGLSQGQDVLVSIRPETIQLIGDGDGAPVNRAPARVAAVTFVGPLTHVDVVADAAPDTTIALKLLGGDAARRLGLGQPVTIGWPARAGWVVPL